MTRALLATAFCAWATLPCGAAAAALLEDAKKSQDEGIRSQDAARERGKLIDLRTRQLAGVLDKILAGLEREGLRFERVQGDSHLNPLPELIKAKVALERHRGTPRLILKPKGGARIYAKISWAADGNGWGYAVMVGPKRVAGKDLRSQEGLEALEPRLREAVLQVIAAKGKP